MSPRAPNGAKNGHDICDGTYLTICSVTVENTYDNIDILGEVPQEVTEEGCEPEETYIIPNCAPGPGPRISESSSTNTNIYTNLLPNNNSEQGTFNMQGKFLSHC